LILPDYAYEKIAGKRTQPVYDEKHKAIIEKADKQIESDWRSQIQDVYEAFHFKRK